VTNIRYPLPATLGFCAVIDGFLTREECAGLVVRAEAVGFGSASPLYPPTYRNNDRLVMDDAGIATGFYERLCGLAPAMLRVHGEDWRIDSVNERVRFCRYGAGHIHQDGVYHPSAECRSMLTFMIYLTDGTEFSGGDTEFYAQGPWGASDVIGRVRPRVGSLILFDHAIWHAGAEVTAGVKHVVRSDVLYRRVDASACDGDGHQGYVWALAALGGGRFASGGRDASIRVWDGSPRPPRRLKGHTQSVLGLARLDGERLASVSRDGTLRLWDLKAADCVRCVMAHHAAVLTVADLGQGQLGTGSADGSVKVWTHEGHAVASIAAHAGWVWKLVQLNDQVFASASEDGCVKLWDCESLQPIVELTGAVPLRAAAVSPDGARLATGDVTGRVRIWEDLLTLPHVTCEFVARDAAVRCLTFVDLQTLVSGGEDCRLRVWRGWPLQLASEAEHGNFVTDVALLDGKRYASCSYDGEIRVHVTQMDAVLGDARRSAGQ
jgi:hypothetical protein